jgi:pantoate--beta-alanine ligase
MWATLSSAPGVRPDYAAAADPETFESPRGDEVLLVVAAYVGTTRLIDNLLVDRALETSRPAPVPVGEE